MSQFKISIPVTASNENEAKQKAAAAMEIMKHITVDNLKILAKKAGEPGMNDLVPKLEGIKPGGLLSKLF